MWEAAYGKSFKIQVSPDATNWTDIFSTTTNTALTNDLTGLTGTGRYVRMYGLTRGTPYGYSLYEMEVYGSQAAPSPDFSLSATPSTQSVAAGGSTTYTATVTPSGGFSGTVGFSASGLPAGASASFNPTTVSGSGSTTMTVTTASSTPVGSSHGDDHGDKREPESSSTVTLTVTSGGTTGSLSGSLATPSGTQNLTSLGTVDWAHWGLTTAGSFNHKAVTQQISNFTIVGTGPANRFTDNAFGYSWTDGTPTGSATNSTTGIYILGVGNGFKITAPADTTQRTLTVYVSAYKARGQMVAHLSDASSPDYVNSTLNGVTSAARGAYTFTYKAASSGQTLSVTFTDITSYGGSSNVTLQAATLVGGYAEPGLFALGGAEHAIGRGRWEHDVHRHGDTLGWV